MTRYDDVRLDGRMPEFARMSLNPGLGHNMMFDLADTILRLDLHESEPDVPSGLRRGSQMWPLGRYLHHKLREMTNTHEVSKDVEIARSIERFTRLQELLANKSLAPTASKEEIIEAFKQDVLNRTSRHRIFNTRGSL